MKIIKYELNNCKGYGILTKSGLVKDITSILLRHKAPFVTMDMINILNKTSTDDLPEVENIKHENIKSPITHLSNIICLGLNSQQHINEIERKNTHKTPTIFFKKNTSLTDPYGDVIYPKIAKKVDWEGEVSFIVGKRAKNVPEKDAANYILGFALLNDISDRYWQFEEGNMEFGKAKSFDTFAPFGPYLVTIDEIQDTNKIDISLKVNGITKQRFDSSEYLYDAFKTLSFCSSFFTLMPGDIIAMGTGPGVGHGTGEYLKIGDTIELSSSILGTQINKIVMENQ